jgi:hypothetical protein
MVGVWGTVGTITAALGAYFFDRLGRRRSFFLSCSFTLLGALMLVILWARFEAGGSVNHTLGSLALWSMFVYLFGYAWIMNAFGKLTPP